jgi:hypothetical protein
VFYSTVRLPAAYLTKKIICTFPVCGKGIDLTVPRIHSRIFPDLPSFDSQTDAAREQTKKLGEKGGPIDALHWMT